MADAIVEGIDLPFEEAIRFFREKASVKTKTWTDVYAAAHSRAFMVAGAASDALVADFRREIEKALEQGTTLEDFREGFDEIVARHGWDHVGSRNWRSRIIFDTNLRTAYAAGRYAQLTEPGTLEAFPFWEYNHSGALHPRQQHLAWDGMALKADDPFWKTNYPPNGWHCGCFVIALSERDLKRQGKKGPDETPDLVFRAEEVGGRKVMVPLGVDPGFEYNPGQAWSSRTAPGSQTVAAAPGVIRRFVRAALSADELEDRSWVPAARVPSDLARALALPPEIEELRLSARTIRQHRHHPEATDAYERLIEHSVSEGTWLRDDAGRVTVLFRDPAGGARWLLGIHMPAGHFRVSTLHLSDRRKHEKIRKRSTLIWEGGKRPEDRE